MLLDHPSQRQGPLVLESKLRSCLSGKQYRICVFINTNTPLWKRSQNQLKHALRVFVRHSSQCNVLGSAGEVRNLVSGVLYSVNVVSRSSVLSSLVRCVEVCLPAVWCSPVWFGVVLCSALWCSVVLCSAVQCGVWSGGGINSSECEKFGHRTAISLLRQRPGLEMQCKEGK